MDTSALARGRAENTAYDRMRHESMRLKDNGNYGKLKIFVSGLKQDDRWCECGCDRLKVWCPNASNH